MSAHHDSSHFASSHTLSSHFGAKIKEFIAAAKQWMAEAGGTIWMAFDGPTLWVSDCPPDTLWTADKTC